MPSWYVYILRCADKSLYTGISNHLEERIKKHNAGKGAAHTLRRKPVALVWKQRGGTDCGARKREAKIKSWNRGEKLKLVRGK